MHVIFYYIQLRNKFCKKLWTLKKKKELQILFSYSLESFDTFQLKLRYCKRKYLLTFCKRLKNLIKLATILYTTCYKRNMHFRCISCIKSKHFNCIFMVDLFCIKSRFYRTGDGNLLNLLRPKILRQHRRQHKN